jgi:hypothetical protein
MDAVLDPEIYILAYLPSHDAPVLRPDNPVQGVVRFADGKRERRLTNKEYLALGDTLRKAEIANIWPAGVAASRFLATSLVRPSQIASV